MSRPSRTRSESLADAAWSPIPASALLAAACTLTAASLTPIRFFPRPNPQGIVSLATVSGYPTQQETFWLVYGVALGALLTWGLGLALARCQPGPRRWTFLELLAAATLTAVLVLPRGFRELAILVGVGASSAIVSRSASATPRAAADGPDSPPYTRSGSKGASRSRPALVLVAIAIAVIAFLRPRFWISAWNLAHGTPDLALASDDWGFHAELGQHLVWADAVRAGGFPGLDYFSLYGPLMTLGLVATWDVLGRSVAAASLYFEWMSALGAIAAMALAAWHLRRPALALVVPFLALPIRGRYGAGLAGLLVFSIALRSGRFGPMFLAGVSAGGVLLYSQEFGLALLLCAIVGLAVGSNGPGRLAFLAGFAAVIGALALWLGGGGALGAALDDLLSYPSLVLAGFGKMPFPAILPALPLSLSALVSGETQLLRLGYVTVTLYVAALLTILGVQRLRPRTLSAELQRLLAELRGEPERLALALVALYGLVAFRSAMGRSALVNLVQASGAAGILLVVALDRSLDGLAVTRTRTFATWRIVALLGTAYLGGFLQGSGAVFLQSARDTAETIAALASGSYVPRGDPSLGRVVAWVRAHRAPEDGVLFLPNHAAYYFLTESPSPIRFGLGHQMVTHEHRRESLDLLRDHPPRFIVWSPHSTVLDGIPHETYLGPDLMRWIRDEYAVVRSQDRTTIYERKAPAPSG